MVSTLSGWDDEFSRCWCLLNCFSRRWFSSHSLSWRWARVLPLTGDGDHLPGGGDHLPGGGDHPPGDGATFAGGWRHIGG